MNGCKAESVAVYISRGWHGAPHFLMGHIHRLTLADKDIHAKPYISRLANNNTGFKVKKHELL